MVRALHKGNKVWQVISEFTNSKISIFIMFIIVIYFILSFFLGCQKTIPSVPPISVATDTPTLRPTNTQIQTVTMTPLQPTVTNTNTMISSTETVTVTFTNTPTIMPTCGGLGEGTADINPTQVTAGSKGNTLVITYTAGPTTWASGLEYGTLKIIIPAGWSAPSTTSSDPGYFTVSVTGGILRATLLNGRDIIIYVNDLFSNTGQIIVTYGATSGGGPGADAQSTTGIAKFTVGMNPNGTVTTEICNSPEVIVIP